MKTKEIISRYFYWPEKFNSEKVWVDRIEIFWSILVNLVLFLIGLVGFLMAVREVLGWYELDYVLKYVAGPEFYWAGIWWSLLVDGFLIFRLLSAAQKGAYYDFQRWKNEREQQYKFGGALREEIEHRQSLEKWTTKKARKIVHKAWKLAERMGYERLEIQHIFLILLNDKKIQKIFWRLGWDYKSLMAKLMASLKSDGRWATEQTIRDFFEWAAVMAIDSGREQIDEYCLLLAISETDGWVKEFLYEVDIETNVLNNVWMWLDLDEGLVTQRGHFKKMAKARPRGSMNKAWTAVMTPFLDEFSNDLTQLARWGRLGLCVGRDEELEQINESFEAGHRAVVLVGYPDVGKSAVIDGLAQRMVADEVPKVLQDKRLVSLSLSKLVAGAGQSGSIEERFRRILFEIELAGNVVLMIDDIHNLVGLSTAGELLDLSKFLNEALNNKSFYLVATSNPVDYRKYLEGKSLGAILKSVNIEEPNENSTIQILEAKAPNIEYKQGVILTYKALKSTYDLCQRYLKERFLPQKAIDLLEEAAMLARKNKGKGCLVTADDAAWALSQKTGIPAAKITEKEADKLLNLEENIHESLVDQNEAVKAVASALRRARAELRDIKKPIASFLFLGPTGVGKTELAKTLARIYFGAEENMARLDMSEYQEKNSLDRMIGRPGEGGGGILTEAIRQKPFTLVLLDEIEKAHPDLLNLFLQVMDDGRLTDNEGRTVDFCNTIIIATSNAGTQFIQEQIEKGVPTAYIKEVLIREQLKNYFKPEFLNRFDEIVVFAPLGVEEIKQIAVLQLKKLKKQLLEKGIDLEVEDKAVVELAQAGFDPLFGARPMKRAIQERVNNALAEYLLRGEITRRDKVILKVGGRIEIKKAQKLSE